MKKWFTCIEKKGDAYMNVQHAQVAIIKTITYERKFNL